MKASWKERLVQLPSAQDLRAILSYDPDTGALTWKKNGREAGCKQRRGNGDPNAIRVGIQIGESLKQFVAHRLIFQIMDEEVPMGMVIDHRDGNPFNNRWVNLRLCSHGLNICNQNRIAKRKSDLPVNVYPNGKGFFAKVALNGKIHRAATRSSIAEALKDRDGLLGLHGEFSKLIES